MVKMFEACYEIKNLNLSRFNTKNVTNMADMFNTCENLQELDLSSFDTKNVSSFAFMFMSCHNLKYIDISSFEINDEINSVVDSDLFAGCNNLKKKKINEKTYKKIKPQIKQDIEIIYPSK